ncbi:dihydroorotate dehydrogenase electron transfer subunit [Geotalea uraniireducens]|uniref:Dihydroorotate dehydrogenase B (NAD(+)), electron transfer subunit n=1 Tax=Geotalea uraniireducens (strain Rf4) TaxID=351605 RepID=A5G3H1_GEOUR|nr:dihydroorotate dehydrogenase electron transfer subunit [Geotalea uraniireducens]ABQ26339.1 dihydroorotate oxidase B, electron transfer subunit [Geotalea uraniireducens Rf4]
MQFKSMIISNIEVSPGYFKMRMTAPPAVRSATPGQFIMVRVRDAIDPLLRRPFGIFDLGTFATAYTDCGTQTYFEILYKVVGKGTEMLSTLHQGDHLDILGPLGKGFMPGDPSGEKILVGGGVGMAPLYYLAKEMVKTSKVRLFAGGRNKEDILCITEFERLGVETYVSTDDGTLGASGLVTEVLEKHLSESIDNKTIFACGPFPMLRAIAAIAGRHDIPCQVSLEAYMACGVGACLGCVMKGRNHSNETPDYRCVCKDGPVFDYRDLQWD